jgi:hypothetical protein
MRAGDLFEQDVRPAEIARQVGVSHQVVADWRAAWLVWLAPKLVVVVASGHLERPAAKALTAAKTLTGIEQRLSGRGLGLTDHDLPSTRAARLRNARAGMARSRASWKRGGGTSALRASASGEGRAGQSRTSPLATRECAKHRVQKRSACESPA